MAGHVSVFLAIVVLDSSIMLSLLSLLSVAESNLFPTQLAFVLTVSKQLLSAQVFLLKSPHFILLLLARREHLVVVALEGTLVHDSAHLVRCKSLKVVWLDAVGGEHALLSAGVFSHEIVVKREILLECSVSLFLKVFVLITVTLFLSHLSVVIDSRRLHSPALCIVVVLSLPQHLRQMCSLFLLLIQFELLLLFVEFLLAALLVNPVGLL